MPAVLSKPIPGLHQGRVAKRLQLLARIGATGVGNEIDLPLLGVFGDQSAGKSSVLEGITSLPFPRRDGLCTRFPTEIILRHSTVDNDIVVSLIPHSSRSVEDAQKLKAMIKHLKSLEQLPVVIDEVTVLMGLRRQEDGIDSKKPTFAADVLRIEVVGDHGLHLTVVDLPGLIVNAGDDQTQADVDLVQAIVDSYLRNPRTIILAIIQATNDAATQGIITRALRNDPNGERTLGIITKPDLINKGTEGRIARLASNKDTIKLTLGFFMLKNPSPEELASSITVEKRRANEREFFSRGNWKDQRLDHSRLGVEHLQTFLQELLARHLERELPKVRKEVQQDLQATEAELTAMSQARPTLAEKRTFLTRLSMDLGKLLTAALIGNYETDQAFFPPGCKLSNSHRLRAQIEMLKDRFATYLRKYGESRKLVASKARRNSGEDKDNFAGKTMKPLALDQKEFLEWIEEVRRNARGSELVGNYSQSLLADLFHEQILNWPDIARKYIQEASDSTQDFLQAAMRHLVKEEEVLFELMTIIGEARQTIESGAKAELERILQDEQGYPSTNQDLFSVSEDEPQAAGADVETVLHELRSPGGAVHFTNTQTDINRLTEVLSRHIISEPSGQASKRALRDLNSYYRIARNRFVDTVCRQVIERHLLSPLQRLFSPETVANFSDEELVRIAQESPMKMEKRLEKTEKLEMLRKCLKELNASS